MNEMLNKEIEDRIIAYFEGDLTDLEKEQLLHQKEESESTKQLFIEYASLYADLGDQQSERPSSSVQMKFTEALLAEKLQAKNVDDSTKPLFVRSIKVSGLMKAAVALILIVGALGVIVSNYNTMRKMNIEITALKSNMQELLQDHSTSMRIKAVNLSYDLNQPDQDILNALINTMNNDVSENVKLAAVEALGKFGHVEQVKQALITALDEHESVYVLTKLIHILSEQKVKKALPSLERLLNNENTSPFVKSEALKGKQKIKNT